MVHRRPQLFLEDRLRQRDWFAYRLRLPGGRAGLLELFKVALAMGDSVSRDTIRRVLNQGEQAWLADAPAVAQESEKDAEA